jgi:hypothetical protein
MKKSLWILFASIGALSAQQVVAPTPETLGPARGQNKGEYNYTNTFEFGYRWSLVGGDDGEYRSVVNYGNGVRLLGSSLSINSKDGHGHYFDQILLNTMGLGNDPYQFTSLRVQKNGLYRYDMTWRLQDYYNPGLTVAGGLHLMDTVRRIQDHELTFFPQSKFRARVGYSRNVQDGPSLTTSLEPDNNSTLSTALPVFVNLRREWNEYRLGGDGEFAGFKFTVLRRWDYYKEDSPYSFLPGSTAAAIGLPNDLTALQTFTKAAPVHGNNGGWLGNLFTTRKRWTVNGRISYLFGRNNYAMTEFSSGLGRLGAEANRVILVQGNAERPMLTGDMGITLQPTSRLTIVNNTSYDNQRTNGPSSYTEVDNGFNFGQTINFRFLGIRMVTNSTDADYRAKDWIGFYAGYHYTYRLVDTIEGLTLPAIPDSSSSVSYQNANSLNTGTVGVRLRAMKSLTVNLEGEVGRADNPLTPVSERNYHALNGRISYRTRKLQLSTTYKQLYNVNAPVSLSAYSSHSRNYTANASFALKNWWSLDASYMKLHLNTIGGIAYFADLTGSGRNTLQTGVSLYISNVHAANLGARFAVSKRADLWVGYTITKDTGDGRSTPTAGAVGPTASLFASVQTFPLTYQSPLARLSVRIYPKLRWNVGWQYYDYHQMFNPFGYYQNFHAQTGYTSVSWAF